MAEKEYIAGDPSDIQNVYRTLKDISILQTKNSKVNGELLNIYRGIEASIHRRTEGEKELVKINISLQDEISKIKSLEDRKAKGLISQKHAQEEILKSYREVNKLLNLQKLAEEKIANEKLNAGKGEEHSKILSQAISDFASAHLKSAYSIAKTWGETASVLFVIYEIFKQIGGIFAEIDEAAMEFRKEMGITRKYTGDLNKFAIDAAASLAKLGVTGHDAYQAMTGISKELYSSASITPELVRDMSLLTAQLDISASQSAELLRNLAIVSHTTSNMQMNSVLFATSLSEAAGTPLKDVMADISNTTKSMYQFVTRSGIEMIKAAVEARRMGTSLDSATRTSSNLLNFTQNVKDEMEASVLLGKSLNLQKARELAYHRNIRGLNQEILKIITDVNYESLDPFQQEAVAKALGKQAGELANMMQAERDRRNIERAMTPEQLKQHKIFQEMLAASDKQVKNYAKMAKETLMQEGNQTRLRNISNAWHKIMMELAVHLLPIIDTVLSFIADHMDDMVKGTALFFGWIKLGSKAIDGMGKIIKGIGISVEFVAMVMSAWVKSLSMVSTGTSLVGRFFQGFGKVISVLGSKIGSVGGAFARFIAFLGRVAPFARPLLGIVSIFGKFLNPIGWIITGIVFIINLFKRLTGVVEVFHQKGFWAAILYGVKAVGGAIYDTLIQPFVDVWNWIMKHLGAHSPSEIGLNILRGIVAVEGMILKALLSPFTSAWNLIKKIPFVSKLFGNKSIDASISPAAQANVTVDKPTISTDTKKSTSISSVVDTMNEELSKQMTAIVDAINALRDDLKNGAITSNVYIDSQKLDSAMGRRLSYTGTLN